MALLGPAELVGHRCGAGESGLLGLLAPLSGLLSAVRVWLSRLAGRGRVGHGVVLPCGLVTFRASNSNGACTVEIRTA